MRILFLTTGPDTPSCRFRILQLVPHLRRLGHHCVVAHSRPPMYGHYRMLGWRASIRLRRFFRALDLLLLRFGAFDVVYLERELFDDDSWDLEARFRRLAPTMLLDIDDGIFLRHPSKFEAVARMSDAVIAGSNLLHDRVTPLNPNVAVIPTCVDLEHYPLVSPSSRTRPIVGWTGTVSNVPFLKLVVEPLRELAREIPFEFRIITNNDAPLRQLDLSGLDVHFIRWDPGTEVNAISTFSIGLMPLPDDEWARYKCGLKIVQYMSLGIAAVASPVGANTDIIHDGENGFLAASSEEWFQAVRRLLVDEETRTTLALAGRATVERQYSIQAQLPWWLKAVESRIRRSGPAPAGLT